MADQDTDLPEGTDAVVTGAENIDTDSAGAGQARNSGGTSPNIMDKVRSGSEKLSEQAADKARGLVGQCIERSAEALNNIGVLIADTAPGLDERIGGDYGDYARRAADTIHDLSNRLAEKDPDELIDDTREFIRKSPAVALAGAAIAGFVLARLIKSGLSGERPGRDEEGERVRS